MRDLGPARCEVRFSTYRGLYYKLQSTSDLSLGFADEPGGFTQALDTQIVRDDSPVGPGKFYRVISSPLP
jgi:hypothetical protein